MSAVRKKTKRAATKSSAKDLASLRRRAEKQLLLNAERLEELSTIDLKKLVHELGTHQIELEIQNEELRNTQVQLETSRLRYLDLYDLAPVGYVTLSASGLILEANLTAGQLLGRTKRSLLDRQFQGFVQDPRDRNEILLHYAAVLSAQVKRTCEVAMRRADGTAFIARLESIAVDDGEGRPVAIRTAISDVTDRKRAEEALRASNAFNQSIIDSSNDCIKLLDMDGRLQFMSQGGQRILGIKDFGKYVNLPYEEFWRGSDRKQVIDVMRKAKQGQSGTFHGFCPTEDGTPKWWEVSISPVLGADGKPEHLLAVSRDITDRKRAEEALRRASEEQNAIFRAVPYLVSLHDREGAWLKANPAVTELFGFDPVTATREEIARKLRARFPDGTPLTPANMPSSRALRGEAVHGVEYIITDPKGTDHTLLVNAIPLKGDGEVQGIVLAQSDITDRKRAEEALRESESKYRSLFDNMIDGFAYHRIVLDEQGKPVDYIFLETNDAFERLTGLKRGDIVGRSVREVLPGIENDPADWIGRYGRVALTGTETRFEQFAASIGKWYYVTAYSPQKDHFVTVFEDVTESRKAEEALRQSEEKLRLFINHAPAAIAMFDKDMNYLSASLRWYMDYHIGSRDIIGRSHYEVFPDIPDNWKEIHRRCLAGAVERSDADRWVRADGTTDWVRWEIRPWYKAGSEIGGIIIFSENITELKEKEMELQTLNSELEQRIVERTAELRNLQAHVEAVREGERAYIAREVHDQLGQTLTALKMDLSWLNRVHPSADPAVQERRAEMLDLVDGAIQSVKRITTELRPAVLDDFGLQAAVEWAAREFEKRSGVKCSVRSYPAMISMDRTHATVIYRVLQESLTNIARHAGAKNVMISLTAEGERFQMTVQDDGKGIPTAQVDDPSSYGLMGMRERARFLGGDITVSGIRGRGTTVLVSIPLSGAEGPAAGTKGAGPSSAGGAGSGKEARR